MSSDKTTMLRAFNNTFFEFIQEVSVIFPENNDIKDAITGLELLKKANPTSIVKAWNIYVYNPYKDQINAGDLAFFCDKDYNSDLNHLVNADEIMKAINRIRDPLKNLSDHNKNIIFKYVSNLCKLCFVYSSL